jgi:glycosyltransferase involved in cell wall biosynthesis
LSSHRLKYLIVHQSGYKAGTYRFARDLATIANKKYDVTFLTNRGAIAPGDIEFVDLIYLKGRFLDSIFSNRLLKILNRLILVFSLPLAYCLLHRELNQLKISKSYKKIHIVSAGWPGGLITYLTILYSIAKGVDAEVSIHNFKSVPRGLNFWVKLSEIWLFKSSKVKFFTVSNYSAIKLLEDGFKANVETIYNGIEWPENIDLNSIRLESKNCRVGFVGMLESRKNPEAILKLSKYDSIDVIVYTPAVTSKFSKKMYSKYSKSVTWNFNVYDKKTIFSSLDILVVSSEEYESFGLVILEAIAFGVVVIANNKMAFPEIIKNGINGFLVKTKDTEELISTIRHINTWSLEELKKFRQEARNYTIKKFDLMNYNEYC